MRDKQPNPTGSKQSSALRKKSSLTPKLMPSRTKAIFAALVLLLNSVRPFVGLPTA